MSAVDLQRHLQALNIHNGLMPRWSVSQSRKQLCWIRYIHHTPHHWHPRRWSYNMSRPLSRRWWEDYSISLPDGSALLPLREVAHCCVPLGWSRNQHHRPYRIAVEEALSGPGPRMSAPSFPGMFEGEKCSEEKLKSNGGVVRMIW